MLSFLRNGIYPILSAVLPTACLLHRVRMRSGPGGMAVRDLRQLAPCARRDHFETPALRMPWKEGGSTQQAQRHGKDATGSASY